MRQSPRDRRLRSDRAALQKLREESTIFDFTPLGETAEHYLIRFHGRGLARFDNDSPVVFRDRHEVRIKLGASYPRQMPELHWQTPIFHPNIAGSGVVCLGGYGTFWVPSLGLDDLCTMLWDMIRYENYDAKSPYNREAAAWVKQQRQYALPIDSRPIRDRVARTRSFRVDQPQWSASTVLQAEVIEDEIVFLDDAPASAEVIQESGQDVLVIDE